MPAANAAHEKSCLLFGMYSMKKYVKTRQTVSDGERARDKGGTCGEGTFRTNNPNDGRNFYAGIARALLN
jgi:hypothetical protein